jgi:GT2 family glycosyltransferase
MPGASPDLDSRSSDRGEGAIVVVPVYGAAEELDRCLAALAATTDLAAHPLVLVFDGPQSDAVEEVVAARLAQVGLPRVLRSGERRGFPVTANRGLAAAAGRDAVLLNSDVETTAGWLDRMADAARSRPRVASVTPLTNNGTLASVPRWFEENTVPAGHTLATFAALVARVSERRRPVVPTGVGFCLYLRREALDEIGGFDEAAFGVGYGEEVDWCLRASAAGFEHLLDDATYLFHRGASSFGTGSARQAKRAQRTLARRHPRYERQIQVFIADEPLRPVLHRIWSALQPARVATAGGEPLRLVHVVHGWPPWNYAGAESYAARLVRGQAARHLVTVYARYAPVDRDHGSALERVDGGARVRLIANTFLQRDPLSRNALHDRGLVEDFGRLLDEFSPDLVHVHHLAGHCLTLTRAAEQRGIPIVWQLQDWWAMCRRANLLDRRRQLCSGPSPIRCSRCLPATGLPPAALWGPLLYGMRLTLARQALAGAAAFAAGSQGVVDDHRRLQLLPPGAPVRIFDYGVPQGPRLPASARDPDGPLRLGFIGTLAPHKGLHVAATALAALPPGRVRLDVWGEPREGAYADEVRLLARGAEIRFHPPFAEGELERVLGGLDLLIAPSLGLESYGLAVAEALAAGLPVLASDRGAFADRLAAGGGALFDPERPETLRALLLHAIDEPDALDTWRRQIPEQVPFTSHAAQIEALYREVLARERRRG